jgi:hypothetical protein
MTRLNIGINRCLFSFFVFLGGLPSYGQDTIKVEKSYYYKTSDLPPRNSRMFHGSMKYGREDIIYSDSASRIEFCYYFNNERNCFGTTYKLIGDSVLSIDSTKWFYKKIASRYFLSRYLDGVYESGWAIKLIPLITDGLFVTTTSDRIDTLWTTAYQSGERNNPYSCPHRKINRLVFSDKIYRADRVDEVPTFMNGDKIDTIRLKKDDLLVFSEPYMYIRTIKFIVTKEGRIVNVEQDFGSFTENDCHDYLYSLMKNIVCRSPLRAAKRKGKNVNVLWIVKVDMLGTD